MIPPEFQIIDHGSAEYSQQSELRNRVLRQPLGLDLYSEDLTAENDQIHFGLFETDGSLIATLIAVPLSPSSAKLRQMAVEPAHARQGHGSTLLRSVEKFLFKKGYSQLSLHARCTAVAFYAKHGYVEVGEIFQELGIPHVLMGKVL